MKMLHRIVLPPFFSIPFFLFATGVYFLASETSQFSVKIENRLPGPIDIFISDTLYDKTPGQINTGDLCTVLKSNNQFYQFASIKNKIVHLAPKEKIEDRWLDVDCNPATVYFTWKNLTCRYDLKEKNVDLIIDQNLMQKTQKQPPINVINQSPVKGSIVVFFKYFLNIWMLFFLTNPSLYLVTLLDKKQ